MTREEALKIIKSAKSKGIKADLMWADLIGADLMGADLRGADLMWVDNIHAKEYLETIKYLKAITKIQNTEAKK